MWLRRLVFSIMNKTIVVLVSLNITHFGWKIKKFEGGEILLTGSACVSDARLSTEIIPLKQNYLLTFILHSNNSFDNKNIYLQTICLQIIYTKKKKDLALNNTQGLICH